MEHLKEKIAGLKQQIQHLAALDARMKAEPDQQISLTDPDSRSMATSGRGSGVVGYNVQVAVESKHHLIVTHEVTNVGNDRAQLAPMAKAAKETLEVETLDVLADRGYFDGDQIKECVEAGVTVTLPKLSTGVEKGPLFGQAGRTALAPAELVRVAQPGRARRREAVERQARFLKRQLSLPVSTISQ